MNKETGGPAFPASYYTDDGEWAKRDGMTLRDYLAAHASNDDILVMLSSIDQVERVRVLNDGRKEIFYDLPDNARQIARYMIADAILKERQK